MQLDPGFLKGLATLGADTFKYHLECYIRMYPEQAEAALQIATENYNGVELAGMIDVINRLTPIGAPPAWLRGWAKQAGAVISVCDSVRVSLADGHTEVPNHLESGLDSAVLCDPELGRLAVARREVSEYLAWSYAHQLKRQGDGSGRIEKNILRVYVMGLGIIASKRTFDDILARGKGLYWRQKSGLNDAGETVTFIELTSWKKLAQKLTKIELKQHPEWVQTNRPGMIRVWVDLSGSLQEAHASLYAAWLGVKAQKTGFVDIARLTLTTLWNRATKTLLEWEKLARIKTEARYAEHHDIHAELAPAHAYLCAEQGGKEFVSWRIANRYIPEPTNIHEHPGQRRKVRRAVNVLVAQSEPAADMGGGRRRVKRTGRIYFTKKQRTRRNGKGGKLTTESVSAYKQLDQHLRKHNDVFERRHYAYLTKRYGIYVYECSTGEANRGKTSHRDFKTEQTPTFRLRRTNYQMGWVDRCN